MVDIEVVGTGVAGNKEVDIEEEDILVGVIFHSPPLSSILFLLMSEQ